MRTWVVSRENESNPKGGEDPLADHGKATGGAQRELGDSRLVKSDKIIRSSDRSSRGGKTEATVGGQETNRSRRKKEKETRRRYLSRLLESRAGQIEGVRW